MPNLDLNFFYTIAAIVLAALAGRYAPGFQSRYGQLALSVLVAAVAYREAVFGYFLWTAIPYGATALVEKLAPSKAARVIRWRFAIIAILFVVGVFAAGSFHLLDGVAVTIQGITWTLPYRDMWLLVRLITFLWEYGSGRIHLPQLLDYSVWFMLPFTVTGPVLRFSEFQPQYQPSLPRKSPILSQRTLLLAFIQMLIAAGLSYVADAVTQEGAQWSKVVLIFGTGPWGFYLWTAGRFHLAEYLASFWGLELPQSFNRPFGQPNISEFWSRWNMTVTRVCRDYLFFNRWGLKKANVYLNTMLVFLAVGLWHSMNLYWASWGLLHGLGFCAFLWYRSNKERYQRAIALVPPAARKIASVVVTYVFVCSCWHLANKIVVLLNR